MVAVRAAQLALLTAIGCASPPPLRPPFATSQAALDAQAGPIAILGDTQQTSLVERLGQREWHPDWPPRLVADLVRQQPAALVLLGDLVFDGASDQDWAAFDQLFANLPQRTVVLPLWGNHEYWSNTELTQLNLDRRFRGLPRHRYYARRVGGVGLLLLDTNLDEQTGGQWLAQLAWYRQQLHAFEHDARVHHVLVMTHHPPVSRGPWGKAEPRVYQDVLPEFLKLGKTRAVLSGHAHGYERYSVGNKVLVITAGGGGPRPNALLKATPPATPPAHRGSRPFNYVLARETGAKLELEVRALMNPAAQGKWAGLGVLECLPLPLPPSDSPPTTYSCK